VSGFRCQDFEFEQRFMMDNYQRLGITMKQRTAEPQNIEYRMSKGGFAALCLVNVKKIEYLPSTFDIRFPFRVSFPIKLATSRPMAGLTPEH
jgi:hypothetical protein